jgi:hypothetical protein
MGDWGYLTSHKAGCGKPGESLSPCWKRVERNQDRQLNPVRLNAEEGNKKLRNDTMLRTLNQLLKVQRVTLADNLAVTGESVGTF